MQITSCELSSTKYVQIFLTKDEVENKETKDLIRQYKKQKYKVALFISGKKNYPELLKKIIEKRVETIEDVC